jgi:hypothetical protein
MAAASLWTALQLVCERLENVGSSRHETAIEVNNYKESLEFLHRCWLKISVADQEPNQDPDPHVIGPLKESGSICQKYGSGSESGFLSFYHYAKLAR